ncbi:MAG: U32 family peptidase [Candidatus Woesearchaeota archaeon]
MELLAPVGDWEMLRAAVQAGADAIYFGIKGINMRAGACNFSLEEVEKVISYCHDNRVKAYCTVNIIIFETELEQIDKTLSLLKEAKVDAVICWDLAVIKRCKELEVEIHLSTQASVSNSESAKLWKEFGVTRIVLARECALEDIREIKEKSGLEIEVFIHGARCISLSGRCLMSYELFDKSANRGECLQPCRREYAVTDEEGKQMKMENNFVMSAKDLCALPLLVKLISIGVDCLKIEGRNRGAAYVHKVVSVYRRALDAINEGTFNYVLTSELMAELKEVYNKDFSTGFLVDYPHHERCDSYGNKSETKRSQLGKVSNYYDQKKVAEFKVETEEFSVEDRLSFVGPTTGYVEVVVSEIHDDNGKLETAKKGMVVSVKVDQKVRKNDKVFLIKK